MGQFIWSFHKAFLLNFRTQHWLRKAFGEYILKYINRTLKIHWECQFHVTLQCVLHLLLGKHHLLDIKCDDNFLTTFTAFNVTVVCSQKSTFIDFIYIIFSHVKAAPIPINLDRNESIGNVSGSIFSFFCQHISIYTHWKMKYCLEQCRFLPLVEENRTPHENLNSQEKRC